MRVQRFSGLLGFEHKTAAFIEIDVSAIYAAIGTLNVYTAFKNIAITGGIITGGVWLWQCKQGTQLCKKS